MNSCSSISTDEEHEIVSNLVKSHKKDVFDFFVEFFEISILFKILSNLL